MVTELGAKLTVEAKGYVRIRYNLSPYPFDCKNQVCMKQVVEIERNRITTTTDVNHPAGKKGNAQRDKRYKYLLAFN